MHTQATEDPLGLLLADTFRLMRRDFDRRIAGIGLTQAQWRALARVRRAEGCRQVDLAEKMEVAPITLARLVDRLEKAGLVERRRHPRDRRAFELHTTARGRRVVDRMRRISTATYDRALTGVAAGERELLVRLLATMRENLTEPPAVTGSRSDRHGRRHRD